MNRSKHGAWETLRAAAVPELKGYGNTALQRGKHSFIE